MFGSSMCYDLRLRLYAVLRISIDDFILNKMYSMCDVRILVNLYDIAKYSTKEEFNTSEADSSSV